MNEWIFNNQFYQTGTSSEKKKEQLVEYQKADIYNKNFFINEELNNLISELNTHVENASNEVLEDIIDDKQ